MNKQEILKKVVSKKDFSDLPERDVEIAFSNFERRQTSDEEKIKLTRDLLRRVFSVFSSDKLFSLKQLDKHNEEWFLKKHISTRERFDFYQEVYKNIFGGIKNKEIFVLDLGAGINGFSSEFFPKDKKINYLAIEGVGQLVTLLNSYFKKNKLTSFSAIKGSLFDLEKILAVLESQNRSRVVFLFKVLDSLEMLKRDYSKELLLSLKNRSERLVVSFATRSLVSRKKFYVNRNWIISFIKENFLVLEDFEVGGERYLIIGPKDK